jgi:cAMP-dependent protein kinase regulator
MIGLLRTVQFQIEPPAYVVRRVADPMPGPSGFRVRVQSRNRPTSRIEYPAIQAASAQALEDEDLALIDAPNLDRSQQDELLASAERRTYGPNETIIQQGDQADAFYILSRGMVDVYLETPGSPAQHLAQIKDGGYFGEIGLLQGIRRTATVRVGPNSSAEVLVLPRTTFLEYVAQFDLIGDEIAALVRRRLISLNLARSLPTLSPEHIAQVSPDIRTQRYAPGEIILRQGDPAETFYILISGRAEVLHRSANGQEQTIDWREPGEYFGEIGLLHDRPRTATVRAAEQGAEALVLEREAFLGLMGTSVATERVIAREMARRLIAVAG